MDEAAFMMTAIKTADIHWIEAIPESLFGSCESLESIDISGARIIGKDAFIACKSLKNVTFGSVEILSEGAFALCDSLNINILPCSLKSIGSSAFSKAVAGIVIPPNVDSIGGKCLGECFEYGGKSKKITIYKSLLYEFRKYFCIEVDRYGREYRTVKMPVAMEITVLDNADNSQVGYIPIFIDDDLDTAGVLIRAFKSDNTFDYSKLDKDIWHNRLKDKDNKLRIATRRLKYPYGIDEKIKEVYAKYVSGYLKEVAREAIRENDIDMLKALYENGLIKKSNLKDFIKYSSDINASECTDFLQKCQCCTSGKEDKSVADDIIIDFKGKKFVTTGLSGKDEKWVINAVESRGGEYKLKFVVSLDYLIYNPIYDRETTKLIKAREQVEKGKPVTILTIDEFKNIVKKKANN